MSQEESEHNEVDRMKKGVDSTSEVMHFFLIDSKLCTTLHHFCKFFIISENSFHKSCNLFSILSGSFDRPFLALKR